MEKLFVNYAEIAIKKGNKRQFENSLVRNIKNRLHDIKIKKEPDRISIELPEKYDKKIVIEKLSKVFGISKFYFGKVLKKDIKEISNIAKTMIKKKSFKIETRRTDKSFPLGSYEISKEIGNIVNNETGVDVDVNNPETTIYVTIRKDDAIVTSEIFRGPSGLPVGSSGRVICLLSGGIDSPVAAWSIMKRGCIPVYVHFHSMRNNKEVIESKMSTMLKILSQYSNVTCYIIPCYMFPEIKGGYNTVIFRRMINKVAEKIAEKEGAEAIVSGESIGQVASQTLRNMNVTNSAVKTQIIRPLSGMNKDEIIEMARKIGTYEVSIMKYKDCCSMLSPNVNTYCDLSKAEEIEKEIDIEKIVKSVIEEADIFTFSNSF